MALLRQCLQELRTKHHEWDVPAATGPEPRGTLKQPLPQAPSLLGHSGRQQARRESAPQSRPQA